MYRIIAAAVLFVAHKQQLYVLFKQW